MDYKITTITLNVITDRQFILENLSSTINQRSFENQKTYVIIVDNMKFSIKLFRSGSIQSTGGNSEKICLKAIKTLLQQLNLPNNILMNKIKITLINATKNFECRINLERLYKILKKNELDFPEITFNYNPIYHTSFSIKLFKDNIETTIMIFNSGNIIFSSKFSIQRLEYDINYITNILNKFKDLIYTFDVMEILKHPKFNNFLLEVMKKKNDIDFSI